MQIETWLLPAAVGLEERGRADVAVVIDVLRATTVITTALAAGARSVTTCADIDAALGIKNDAEKIDSDVPLLCGERECQRIEGFDFGNSPADYSPAAVGDRRLVMTTTNGTRAIEAAGDCGVMLLACFANLSAVASAVIAELADDATSQPPRTSGRLRIVCAGTNGAITSEDVLLAGALIAVLHRGLSDTARFYDGPLELVNDSGSIALAAWQHCITHDKVTDADTLATRLALTQGGRNLIAAGFERDLVDCGSIDVFDNVPRRDQVSPSRFI